MHPAVNQAQVEALYSRFRALDRGRKGYITADECLAIPELSINPLAQRMVSRGGYPCMCGEARQNERHPVQKSSN